MIEEIAETAYDLWRKRNGYGKMVSWDEMHYGDRARCISDAGDVIIALRMLNLAIVPGNLYLKERGNDFHPMVRRGIEAEDKFHKIAAEDPYGKHRRGDLIVDIYHAMVDAAPEIVPYTPEPDNPDGN